MGHDHTPPATALADPEGMLDLAAVEALPILLVDDQPENLRTLEAVLDPLGYPLRTASRGTERCACCSSRTSR